VRVQEEIAHIDGLRVRQTVMLVPHCGYASSCHTSCMRGSVDVAACDSCALCELGAVVCYRVVCDRV
jgi:hypothetical protein